MQARLRLAGYLIIMISVFLIGCAVAPPQPKTVYELVSGPDSPTSLDKDGLLIEVKPIGLQNYANFPKVYTTTDYATADGKTKGVMNYIVLDIPAFEFSITNNTGHVIRFSKATLKMQDNNGEMYDAKMKSDINDMIDIFAQSYKAQGVVINTLPLKTKVQSIKIIDRNFELLPNITEKGYFCPNLALASIAATEKFLAERQYLKVLLYEIPTLTDEAGEVKKTTNFEFTFNITSKTITPAK